MVKYPYATLVYSAELGQFISVEGEVIQRKNLWLWISLVSMEVDEGNGVLTPSWDRLLTARELEEGFLGLSPASPTSTGKKC